MIPDKGKGVKRDEGLRENCSLPAVKGGGAKEGLWENCPSAGPEGEIKRGEEGGIGFSDKTGAKNIEEGKGRMDSESGDSETGGEEIADEIEEGAVRDEKLLPVESEGIENDDEDWG